MAALTSCSLPASATQPDSQPVSQPSLTAANAGQLHSASYGQPASQPVANASQLQPAPATHSQQASQPAKASPRQSDLGNAAGC